MKNDRICRPADRADMAIDGFLRSLGYSGNEAPTRVALEAAGLTNPRKSRMSRTKLDAAERLLHDTFALACADERCRTAVASARRGATVLIVQDQALCERCAGSANARSARTFLEACVASGVRHLVVVGGSPATRVDLLSAIGASLDVRLVDGTAKRSVEQARADLAWADLVLIWGATQLDHKVSGLYAGRSKCRTKVVGTARRGVAALLDAGADHCRRASHVHD